MHSHAGAWEREGTPPFPHRRESGMDRTLFYRCDSTFLRKRKCDLTLPGHIPLSWDKTWQNNNIVGASLADALETIFMLHRAPAAHSAFK